MNQKRVDTAIAEAKPLEPQQAEPDAAYRIDPDGPTTIGRERARLLNSAPDLSEHSSDRDVERANDIAARDDELEALAEEHGDDAAISFTDPAEQEAAISAQDVRYPGQPEAESSQRSAEEVFELRPDIFQAQPDSVLEDDPELLYQDGERDFIRDAPPFDYHETLDHLREQVASLPEDQQAQLMRAIQQTEAQLNGEAVEPAPETEPVPAGEFVQSAISQQDPELDEQLAVPSEDDSPTVEAFRDWYRAARSLGRSEQGLKQIETLGKAAKAGNLEGLDPDLRP